MPGVAGTRNTGLQVPLRISLLIMVLRGLVYRGFDPIGKKIGGGGVYNDGWCHKTQIRRGGVPRIRAL